MGRILQIGAIAGAIPSFAASSIQMMRMAEAFAALGHEVTLVAPSGRLGRAADPFAFYGVRARFAIERVWAGGGGRLGTLAFAWAARRMAMRGAWDVIFSRHPMATVLLARAGVPHVFEAHHYRVAGRVDRWLMEALRTPYVRRVVVLASALVEPFVAAGVPAAKILVAPDGAALVEAAHHAPRAGAGSFLVAYAGSLSALKGTDTLLAAAQKLPEVRFTLAGGPVRDYQRMAGSNVCFVGPVPPAEVPPLLAAADVLVLPHARASAERHLSPLKLFEYLAAGKPIVATDLPAVRDLLAGGVNALLVPPDDPGALAAAIGRLAGDAALRQRLSAAARATAREHTWTARARRVLEGLPAPAGGLSIAHVINSFHPIVGGAERQAATLAAQQAASGHEVMVVTRRRSGLDGLGGLDAVAIHRVRAPLGALGFALAGALLLRGRRIDVVHAHQARGPALVAFLARALGGPPFVVKLAGLDVPEAHTLETGLRLAILRRADAVVAVTPGMGGALARLGISHLHVIPNGVDCERFRPASDEERGAARAALGLPAGDPIAVFVGRLERVKGPDLLIDAWAKLAHPAAWLVVAGDGRERAALEARGAPRVRFLGAVGDPVPLYRAANVAVVPSRSEGLSNALLEAMASGLSVVATTASAEVIEDGRTGRLVEPRAEAIANALAGALGARHASLGEAAARAARERYSLDATAAAYVALYRRLIGGRRRRGPGRRSS